jgi:energy-coupling factor transporter ATP-binding protein EcfA2
MNTKTLIIKRLVRTPIVDPEDCLEFKPGVNLLVGPSNAGKSLWLQMLDYLMGDKTNPEKEFDPDVFQKYDTVEGVFEIDGEEILLERRLKTEGAMGKVFVNGEPLATDDFSNYLLSKLGMPVLRYPQGNPYSGRTWPSLAWRSLLRHIYRKEDCYRDLADGQYDVEQHASLAMFLGAAEALFPESYGELVKKRIELNRLENLRQNYDTILGSLMREMLNQKEMTVALTKDSLAEAETRIINEIEEIKTAQDKLLRRVQEQQSIDTGSKLDAFIIEAATLNADLENIYRDRSDTAKRSDEISEYLLTISGELERIKRIKVADQLISPLKVTQCPVCDQAVIPQNRSVCYLCGKSHPRTTNHKEQITKRLGFEEQQLQEEVQELQEILERLASATTTNDQLINSIKVRIGKINTETATARKLATLLLPPDLSLLERQTGRLQEQLDQLQRMNRTLDEMATLETQIVELQKREESLRNELESAAPDIDYRFRSRRFQDLLNTYLNKLNLNDKKRWDLKEVHFNFGPPRKLDITIEDRSWSKKAGGKSKVYMLFAYHYALLALTKEDFAYYPGIVIIDFPPQLGDDIDVADAENYLLEPFVELCAMDGMEYTQLIAAGHSFANLKGVNRIEIPKRERKKTENTENL